MKVFWRIQDVPYEPATVLSVGTFDGVHRGHQAIIRKMLETADRERCRNFLVTFHPHPRTVLESKNREPIRLLSTIEERLELFDHLGVQYVLVVQFDLEFAQLPPERFVKQYLVDSIGVQKIFVGTDHAFGKARRGNVELLRQFGKTYNFTVCAIDPVFYHGERISSTRIRRTLMEGQLHDANQMLGYHYLVCGTVVRGDGRGQLIGFPTANIEPLDQHKLLPKSGVYFVSAVIDKKQVFGMANIGTRPTFTDDSQIHLEVHFLNFDQQIYDKKICVSFLEYLRPEQKFDTVDLLVSQLYDDRITCEELMKHYQNFSTRNVIFVD